ncbi:YhcG family protein [Methanobrevibacter arboriphilus]|uniref:PDDEXK nuclease domain-containing protein n=1 Tax=Methanobrevibacter arboriphilus TaxID=39441 RepID=UPI0006D10EC2|nr:PDDEXK nuclease domain-containing protein [Methanobrevibacter arboriphilus]
MTNTNINKFHQEDFTNILKMIKKSQISALKSVNTELIDLYWNIGKFIHQRVEKSNWGGQSVVKQLADYLKKADPSLKGFSRQNLWRMKQFYETYKDHQKLSALLREITWTNNVAIFSRCKTIDEREFYIYQSKKEKWSSRELDRQISSSLYERMMISNNKISSKLKEVYPKSASYFKDDYVFEFLDLEDHSENQLQKALIKNLKKFILELGRDFLFVGKEYRIQVGGNNDFYIDLLFFNRELQCLVAFELKTDKFKPEHLGQLNFYLEALDRDVKKEQENPSIGILLCRDKDDTVVEYAISRSLSPSMVSQYRTKLPDKKLLKEKLNQIL